MATDVEYRCFVGGLSWDTDDRSLNKAFERYGAVDAKVVNDRETGRSRGFGFVTFSDKAGMDEAIDAMNGQELDGRMISVNVAQPRGSGGPRSSYGGGRGGGSYGGGGSRYGGGSDSYGGGGGGYRDGGSKYSSGGGGSRGGATGECYKCGEAGHFARDCPSGDGGGGGGSRRSGYSGSGSGYSGGGGGGGGGGGSYSGGYGGDGGYEGRGGPDRYSGSRSSSRSGPYDRAPGDSRSYD